MQLYYLKKQCIKLLDLYFDTLYKVGKLEQKMERRVNYCILKGKKLTDSSLALYTRLLNMGNQLITIKKSIEHYCDLIRQQEVTCGQVCYA